jgi:CxxC motif-containing protein (DUF1111 family)
MLSASGFRVILVVALYSLTSNTIAQDVSEKKPVPLTGKQLFERKWTANDPVAKGDGLGPLFNATSCVECHIQGGVGGAGPNELNLQLVGVHWDRLTDNQISQKRDDIKSIHPRLPGIRSMVLHRLSTDSKFEAWRYEVLGIKVPTKLRRHGLTDYDRDRFDRMIGKRTGAKSGPDFFKSHDVPLVRTERNTPSLFGAGLIDAISEDALIELCDQQLGREFGVSGRLSRAHPEFEDPLEAKPDPKDKPVKKIGKFGWKGQTASLKEFVVSACANELGLQTENHPQADVILASHKHFLVGFRDNDLSNKQCENLVDYVGKLPPPRQHSSLPSHRLRYGELIFESVGCATCHVRKVDQVDGLYSDLLLHDMGAALADPVLAKAAEDDPIEVPLQPPQKATGNAYESSFDRSLVDGRSRAEVDSKIRELSREWRTPPLWGIADSAPYLHDGRAETLHDAIILHDGESAMIRRRYLELSVDDRKALLQFLNSLTNKPADAVVINR